MHVVLCVELYAVGRKCALPIPPDWSQMVKRFVDEWKQNPRAEEYIGDAPFPNFVLTEVANCWQDFLDWSGELQGSWCYRGQRESCWSLLTSLDRAVRRNIFKDSADGIRTTGYYHLDREAEQQELLFRFQQQAHLYISQVPPDGDFASWFALMQHHGAPTRFLDWTKSPYVAAYFALEDEAQRDEKRSAVWAIDLDWLETRGRKLLQSKEFAMPENPQDRATWVNSLLAKCEEAAIVRVEPIRNNERMAAQQGVFLCKLLHLASFSQTLMRMIVHPEVPGQPVLRKLELQAGSRKEFLRNLRTMNIHRASLFPGLDGFAQSLRLDLEIKGGNEGM